jgi:hypothetical protein
MQYCTLTPNPAGLHFRRFVGRGQVVRERDAGARIRGRYNHRDRRRRERVAFALTPPSQDGFGSRVLGGGPGKPRGPISYQEPRILRSLLWSLALLLPVTRGALVRNIDNQLPSSTAAHRQIQTRHYGGGLHGVRQTNVRLDWTSSFESTHVSNSATSRRFKCCRQIRPT